MPLYSEETMRDMMRRAEASREASGNLGGSLWLRTYGKRSPVKPGESLVLRLIPRWDFMAKLYVRDASGQVVRNPAYVPDDPCCYAQEHWFTTVNGERRCHWCLASWDDNVECPGCIRADELAESSIPQEKDAGEEMFRKGAFCYASVVRAQPVANGTILPRIYVANDLVFQQIVAICTGRMNSAMMCGDIADWEEGRDITITRPATQGKGYLVQVAPHPSRLYPQSDAALWGKWWEHIPNIEQLIRAEMATPQQFWNDLGGSRAGRVGHVMPPTYPGASPYAPPQPGPYAPPQPGPYAPPQPGPYAPPQPGPYAPPAPFTPSAPLSSGGVQLPMPGAPTTTTAQPPVAGGSPFPGDSLPFNSPAGAPGVALPGGAPFVPEPTPTPTRAPEPPTVAETAADAGRAASRRRSGRSTRRTR